MLTLGIDTSTEIGAIGLINERELLAEINIRLYRRHSERLMPNIKYIFSESGRDINEVEGMAVTVGPGSFTGLRIGLSTVKAFAQYLGIPVIGISTLDVLAYSIHKYSGWIVPIIDARRDRVYTALYQGGERDIIDCKKWQDQALSVNELIKKLDNLSSAPVFLLGNGTNVYRDKLKKAKLNFNLADNFNNQPRGGVVAELGEYYLNQGIEDDLYQLSPNYLKKPQAEINYNSGD